MSDEPVKITTASRRCTTQSHNVSAVWRSWHLCFSCLEFLHHIIAKECENLGDSSKVVWLLLSQKAGCDSNLKTTLQRRWTSIFDQLSADKMTCTPVLSDLLLLHQLFWMLTHQQRGSFFGLWWKRVWPVSSAGVWTDFPHADWGGYNSWRRCTSLPDHSTPARRPRGALEPPWLGVKAKQTRILPAPGKSWIQSKCFWMLTPGHHVQFTPAF